MPKVIEDGIVYQAVMQVISERGYTGATTKQMADAAKISEVTLFRKYGSKVQLVKQAISSIVVETDFGSAAHYTGDITSDLMRVVSAYQAAAVKNGLFFTALFSEMARIPDLIDSFDEPLGIFRAIGQLIARYQEEGKLRVENPLHAVAALLGPLMYLAMMQTGIPKEPLQPIDLASHVAYFLEGVSLDNTLSNEYQSDLFTTPKIVFSLSIQINPSSELLVSMRQNLLNNIHRA